MMKKLIAITALGLLAWAVPESQADAGGFRFGIGSGYGGYGGGFGGYGYGGYGYGGYGGSFRNYPHAHRWHDTSHLDYHPGSFQRHYNHYHYVPGHYHLHRQGHLDHFHNTPWGGHWHHGGWGY